MPLEKKPAYKGLGLSNDEQQTERTHFGKGRSWFLGIGINDYREFPNLNNAVKDVEDIGGLLLKKYDVDVECIIMLTNEKATREEIIDCLDDLQNKVSPEDKLIIYYSGHGHYNKDTGFGFWIPHDAKKGRTANYLRNSTVRDYIKAIKSRHTLLISDSCFSGALFVRGTNRSTTVMDELEAIPSRWAIASGRSDEEVYDGEPGANSPFAESILDTLSDNYKSELNVAKLADRVVEQTRSNYSQLPEGNPLQGVGHKGGQYVFRLKANEYDEWTAAKKVNTLAAYRQFLLKYPKGQFAGEAARKIGIMEKESWEKAKATATILAYFNHNQAFPGGRYNRQATGAIARLEEEESWQGAVQTDKLSAYLQYVSDYPDGEYKEEATARIGEIAPGKLAEARGALAAGKLKEQRPGSIERKRKKTFAQLRKYAPWLVPLLLSPLLVLLIISLLNGSPEEDPAGNEIMPARSMIMPAGKMGDILYKIPAIAILNEETTAVIRLAFEGESKAQLPEVSGGAGYQSIRISEVREVRLLQPDTEPAFDIHPDISVRPANEALAQHDWTFRLTPLREGTFTLTLRLAVVEIVLGTERKREINLRESIRVITTRSGETTSANSVVFKPSGYSLAGLEYEPEAIAEEREPAKKVPDTDLPDEKKAASDQGSTKNQESRDPDIPSIAEVITKPQTDQNIHTTLLSHLKVKIIYADKTRGVKDEVEKMLTNSYRIFVTADKLLNAQMEPLNRISYSNNRKEHALALQKELGAKGNFELQVMRSVEDDFDLIIMLGIPYQK